jgi:hypothetical protein
MTHLVRLLKLLDPEISEGLRHQDELLENWERAQRLEPLERIPGADQDD